MPDFLTRPVNLFIGIAVLALIALIGLSYCGHQRDRAAQAAQDARSARSEAATAKDAAETVIARSEADMTLDEAVNATVKEIENETDATVSGATARRAICGMPNYRDDPACRLP